MLEAGGGRFVPNFSYRYLSEDIPFGLAVTRAFAELAGVETPAIDEMLRWAQGKLDKSYLVDGRLNGPDAQTLPIPQNAGIETLDDLIEWYAAQGSLAARLESAEAV
jgi:hypothetical protein